MNLINKALLALSMILVCCSNPKSQKKSEDANHLKLRPLSEQFRSEDANHLKLTPLSEQLLEMFITDSMNYERLDPSKCSIVLSFVDQSEKDIDLWIYDSDLLVSCIDHSYVTRYKGFNIFYQFKINGKYLSGISDEKLKCSKCDSLLKVRKNPYEYDGSIYKVYKETNEINKKIVKVRGG
jgi:hypothetical protein